MSDGLKEIQENIAKLKGSNPAEVGGNLLDASAKRATEIAAALAKTVEDIKKQGAEIATNAIDKVVDTSKKLGDAAAPAKENEAKPDAAAEAA